MDKNTDHNEKIYLLKHFTCLCKLYKSKSICCKKGYSNLIKTVPYIAVYSANPIVIDASYIHCSLNYKSSDKSVLEILSFAYEQKLEAFKNPIRYEGKQLNIKYAKNDIYDVTFKCTFNCIMSGR